MYNFPGLSTEMWERFTGKVMMVVLAYSGHVEQRGPSPLLCSSVGFQTLNAKKDWEVVVTLNKQRPLELLEVQLPIFWFVFITFYKEKNTVV